MNSGPHPSHTPAQGLAFALSGFALLSFGDAVVKSLHGAWLGPAFAMLRYAIALMGLTLWIWFHQGRAGFACPRPWVQLGRGASVSFSAGCFFAGLQFLPLAEMTAIQFTIWLPYPVIRLAWFFCYLDQRIRNECWDLQLQFRAEAARLEELAA